MVLQLRHKTPKSRVYLFLIAILFLNLFVSSCGFYKTLATFDLGENRVLKITRSHFNPNLPIYCEVLINNEIVKKEVIEYEGLLLNYRYELFRDISNKKFALVQVSPHLTQPEVVFDFDEFECPLIYNKYNQDLCKSSKSNQIMEAVEKNNPHLTLNRFSENLKTDCEN